MTDSQQPPIPSPTKVAVDDRHTDLIRLLQLLAAEIVRQQLFSTTTQPLPERNLEPQRPQIKE